MFKITRSKPLASAVRVLQVLLIELSTRTSGTDILQREAFRDSNIQQKRFLSIHEYLSANLLKEVSLGLIIRRKW